MPLNSADLLAKLTAAVMADSALSEQVRMYEEDTFESFVLWLRTTGIEVIVHGKYGPPVRSYLFMGNNGTHLYHRPWYKYPSLSMFPVKRIPHRRYATGDLDLRYVDDIRRGRSTTNTLRTKKFLIEDDDVRGPLLISIISPVQTLDLDIVDQTDRLRFMAGLTTLILPSLASFGLPAGIQREENNFPGSRSLTPATERFASPPSDIRASVYKVMYNPWMDKLILSCIIISTITMGMNGVSAQSDENMVKSLATVEWTVATVFILEAILRMVAMEGFWPYWRDPWNRLDFVIVVLGIITELPFVANLKFSAFRAFRALRALRTMKYAQGVRQIVDTFIETFRRIVNVLFVYGYFCFLFSALGIDLFRNGLSGRCMVDGEKSDLNATGVSSSVSGVHTNSTNRTQPAFVIASPVQYCNPDTTAQSCSSQQNCRYVGNPGSGFVSFDSFGPAALTVIRIAGRAPGISTPLRALMQTTSQWSMLFFIAISIFISCLVMALFIAVVRLSFIAVRKHREAQAKALSDAKKEAEESCQKMSVAKSKKNAESPVHSDKTNGSSPQENHSLDINRDDSPIENKPKEDGDSESEDKRNRMEADSRNKKPREDEPLDRVCMCLASDSPIVGYIHNFIMHSWTTAGINICILFNCVFLAMEHYKMSDNIQLILKTGEVFFTIIFLLEMVLKIIGLKGIRNYLLVHEDCFWNQFDCIIVCMTCLDLLLQEIANGLIPLSLLRIFRLGRIMKMLRNIKDLMKIVYAIINSISAMLNLLLFVLLIIILFAILGMQLFGGQFRKTKTWVNGTLQLLPPRSNFDEFGPSMLTLFKIITGGGGTWGITYDALQTESAWAAFPYFFGFTVFGVFITLNYLVVIIMGQFAINAEEKRRLRQSREVILRKRASTRLNKTSSISKNDGKHFRNANGATNTSALDSQSSHLKRETNTTFERFIIPRFVSRERAHMSLLCIRRSNPFRMLMKKIVSSWSFEAGIICAIVVSSVTLTLESPLYKDPTLAQVLQVCDIFFLIIFSIEAVMKVIAFGFILPYDSYLSDSWNKLDFIVLVVTFAGMAGSSSGIGRTLRVGRILRPLRMINRWEGMRVIVDALLRSLPAVGYTVILLAVYLFLFAVLGLTIFLGRFYRCNDPSIIRRENCRGIFENKAGVMVPRVWANPPYSFDNIFSGMFTLCSVISRRAWLDVLNSGMDITLEGYQPVRNASPLNAIFFVIFLFVGAFFMLKIFVGIIVGTFRQYSGTALLTSGQIRWLATKRMMRRVRIKQAPPTSCVRRVAHSIVSNRYFEGFITSCILVHILGVATQNPQQLSLHTSILEHIHWIATGIYISEITLRVIASGGSQFFLRSEHMFWNIFDTCAVAGMLIVPIWSGSYAGLRVARALQFGRITRLLRQFKGIENLFEVLSMSVPAMLNVVVLFLLMLFVFAVLGMQLFAVVKDGPWLSNLANFKTFPQALITLFQIVAGENWIPIMRDCSVEPPACLPVSFSNQLTNAWHDRGDCGSSTSAGLYFFGFFVMVFCVFLNLFVAIVLDTFIMFQSVSDVAGKDEKIFVKEKDFEIFRDTWFELDPESTGMISSSSVNAFITRLHEQQSLLGFDVMSKEHNVTRRLAGIHARCHDFDLAAVGRKSNGSTHTIRQKKKKNTLVLPADIPKMHRRTIPFGDLLYMLSSGLVPQDSLDADGFVRMAMNENRVKMTMSAIKIQRWAIGVLNLRHSHLKKNNSEHEKDKKRSKRIELTTKVSKDVLKDGGAKSAERLSLHQRRLSQGTHPLTGLKLRIPA